MTVIKYSYYLTLPDDEKVTETIYEQPHVFNTGTLISKDDTDV